jgi:hypothetical protein
MKALNCKLFPLALPLAASLTLIACADRGYREDRPHGYARAEYRDYSPEPELYVTSVYVYNGRSYTGGRYETGRYHYNNRDYNNRYYHEGRYIYGGTQQQQKVSAPKRDQHDKKSQSNKQDGKKDGKKSKKTSVQTEPQPRERTY